MDSHDDDSNNANSASAVEQLPPPQPDRSAMAEATSSIQAAASEGEAPRDDESYKSVKPAEKHFPVSKQEVDQFADRMDHISRVLHDFLNEDPVEAAERKKQRELARHAERAQAEKQKLVDRYDPRRYVRFESDELINKLLEAVDKPAPAAKTNPRVTHLSDFETLTLEQAEAKKKEGNTAFAQGDWTKAAEMYTLAIELEPVDDDLVLALRNNRSQVNINLGKFVTAAEDATVVIQRHPTNVKARMRRARALLELHRPHEALQDIEAALRGEPKNNDALRLAERIRLEKIEVERCNEFQQRSKSAAAQVIANASALKSAQLPTTTVAAMTTTVDGGDANPIVSNTTNNNGNNNGNLQHIAESLTSLASTLVACVDALDERGSETLFRVHGGGDGAFRAFKGLCSFIESKTSDSANTKETPAANTTDAQQLEEILLQSLEAQTLTASIRLLALYARSHVNLLILGDEALSYCIRMAVDIALSKRSSPDDASVPPTALSPLCRRLFIVEGLTSPSSASGASKSAAAKKKSSDAAQKPAMKEEIEFHAAIRTAALQLLEAITSNGTPTAIRSIADAIPASEATLLLEKGGRSADGPDATTYFALRLFDGLLRHEPTAATTYASVDFTSLCLRCVNTKRVVFAEAAVGMMVRLSVTQPHVVQSAMTKSSDLLSSLCTLLCAGLSGGRLSGASSTNSKVALTSEEVDAVQHSPLLLEGICSLFFNRTLLLPSLEERQSFLQRLQREQCFASALMWLEKNIDTLLTDAHASRNVLNVAARVIGLLGKASVSAPDTVVEGLIASESTVLWRLYALEALFPSATVGSPLWDAAEYVDEQKYVQQCIEHASICLAVLYTTAKVSPLNLTRQRLSVLLGLLNLKRQPVTVGNIAMILSAVPKDLHDVFGDLGCVKSMIDGLVELRTDLFALESEGKRGTTMHQQTQSAQKNVAIALSRVCATEALLEKVRELRGFEVLYAALDRNADGSIKEK